ncbi:MAG TPA: hypothetical protein PKI46_01740 [Bacteroidales bacterium]|nr:hypothetical protein [Bacteroidales bacterium]
MRKEIYLNNGNIFITDTKYFFIYSKNKDFIMSMFNYALNKDNYIEYNDTFIEIMLKHNVYSNIGVLLLELTCVVVSKDNTLLYSQKVRTKIKMTLTKNSIKINTNKFLHKILIENKHLLNSLLNIIYAENRKERIFKTK